MMNKSNWAIIIALLLPILSCSKREPPKSALYISTSDGNQYAIDLKTDKLKWRTEGRKEDQLLSYFSIKGDKIVKASHSKTFYEINKNTGKVNWTYQDKLSANRAYYGYDFSEIIDVCFSQYPVLYKNAMIYGNTQGELKSVDLTTKRVNWTWQASVPVSFPPSLLNDRLILNFGYQIMCFSANTGKRFESLEFKTAVPNETTVDGNHFYVADEEGSAFCIDSNMNTVWVYNPTDKDRSSSKVVTGKSQVIYGTDRITSLDKTTGKLQWTTLLPNDAGAVSIELIANEISINCFHHIFVLDSASGKILREKNIPKSELTGRMRYANGFYYYWTTNNTLYKIDKDLKSESVVYKAGGTTPMNDTYMIAE